MIADMDLQVWLATQERSAQPALVVPYVRTDKDAHLNYSMEVVKRGAAGSSRIRQGGSINAIAGTPTALAQVAVDVKPDDACYIEVMLRYAGAMHGPYRFDCPR
ncbi:curli-like amyloid fiber formation chaperone CsgH [Noviherbaspirillum sp.]|uniref:curli-like amyloid fiber formation chaperone CsgH n=1 Tax=Noviherbaspirillum sp. TaxID=1926288 RepID=UPI002D3B2819|nr:curli-like amyloid fiber formation chaperone CsgH [Noviherbaspirillum sp.]HZW20245.1 curli-like amyloid fiber formation chaperone CsgH [Noviherbaspirillum sp.]